MKNYLRLVLVVAILACWGLLGAGEITTKDGKVYKNIKGVITKPDGLVLILPNEEVKIDFENLSVELQEKYHFDPAKAAEYRAKQSAKAKKDEARKRKYLKKQQDAAFELERRVEKIKNFMIYKGKLYVVNKATRFKALTDYGYIPAKVGTFVVAVNISDKNYFKIGNKIYEPPFEQKKQPYRYLTSAREKLIELQKAVDLIKKLPGMIADAEKKIARAITQISAIVGDEYSQVSLFYDENGKFIGSVELYNRLSMAQRRVLAELHRTIREQRKLIKKLRAPLKDKKAISELNSNYRALKTAVEDFDAARELANQDLIERFQEKAAKKSVKERLQKLKALYDEKLITEEEYKKKKAEVLEEL